MRMHEDTVVNFLKSKGSSFLWGSYCVGTLSIVLHSLSLCAIDSKA